MRNRIAFITSILILTGIAACKKDKTETPTDNGNDNTGVSAEMKLITDGSWEMYKAEVNGVDIWKLLIEDCQKDDSYQFRPDSVLMHYENANVCQGMQDSTASNWYFIDNRTKIYGSIIGITDTANINQLNSTNMILGVDYSGNPAVLYFKKH